MLHAALAGLNTVLQVTSAVRVIAKYHAFTVTLPSPYVESYKPEYSRHFEVNNLV